MEAGGGGQRVKGEPGRLGLVWPTWKREGKREWGRLGWAREKKKGEGGCGLGQGERKRERLLLARERKKKEKERRRKEKRGKRKGDGGGPLKVTRFYFSNFIFFIDLFNLQDGCVPL